MKKILFGLIILCVIFSSCKKEHKNAMEPDTSLHEVTFNVGFSAITTGFETRALKVNSTTADTSITNNIDVIYYMVFDSNGNGLHTITQLKTDTGFGHYVDKLRTGSYTVVISAGKTGLLFSPNVNNTLSNTFLYYHSPDIFSQTFVYAFNEDAYYKKIALTVSGSNSSQSVALDRITSKLTLNIEDAIPLSATYGLLTISGAANEYFVGTGTTTIVTSLDYTNIVTVSHHFTAAEINTTNFKFSTAYLYNGGPLSVSVLCGTTPPNMIIFGEKNISNVTGAVNTPTYLTGTLFGGSSSGTGVGFTPSLDPVWNAPVVTHF